MLMSNMRGILRIGYATEGCSSESLERRCTEGLQSRAHPNDAMEQ